MPESLERLSQDAKASETALREAQARLLEMRQAHAKAVENPLSFPAASYSRTIDNLRHAVAQAEADASRAEAVRAQSAEALRAARLAHAEAEEPRAQAEAEEALSAFVEASRSASERLAQALAIAQEKIASRDSLRAELDKNRRPHGTDAQPGLAFFWKSLQGASALDTAARVFHWASETVTAQREGQWKEEQRRLELDRARAYEEACRRGAYGEKERDRAAKEASEAEARFHSSAPSPSELSIRTTSAGLELALMRRNAGLKDR